MLEQLSINAAPGALYEDALPLPEGVACPVRLIAYYLPQFHPIPENDQWWGRGFTDWTNVTKAVPRFEGHYQPHLPGELGFYDLRLPSVLARQAELVREYGLHGLCFHHYWFDGSPLLDAPIRMLMARPEIDLRFCVNWANEPWSRRWDGLDQDVLKAQRHSAEDDLAFAASLLPLFRDRRYITVDGRPLLMVYRPGILPDARATVRRWRAFFKSEGVAEPYFVMAQGFGEQDPRPHGMDASAGFPPHITGFDAEPVQSELTLLDPGFSGKAVAYDAMVGRALSAPIPSYREFPGVCPSWDNEARRPGRGFVVLGSTPAAYENWLRAACERTMGVPAGERIVFINAWNEWAEGAHLEPDRHYGYAWLRATARVVAELAGKPLGEHSDLPVLGSTGVTKGRQKRRARDVPGLLLKNVMFHAANALDWTAERARRGSRRL